MRKTATGLILFVLDGLGMFLFKNFPDFHRYLSFFHLGYCSGFIICYSDHDIDRFDQEHDKYKENRGILLVIKFLIHHQYRRHDH